MDFREGIGRASAISVRASQPLRLWTVYFTYSTADVTCPVYSIDRIEDRTHTASTNASRVGIIRRTYTFVYPPNFTTQSIYCVVKGYVDPHGQIESCFRKLESPTNTQSGVSSVVLFGMLIGVGVVFRRLTSFVSQY